MRIGVHVSIAGKIYDSLERAHAIGCDAMQIFSRNPRGWEASKLDPMDVKEFKKLKAAYDIHPVVVHIPYIINLASPDDVLYKRSIKAYIDDIARADELGAEYFVTHMGSHVGSGEDNGIRRFSEALNEIIRTAKPNITILLENTAGSGASIGSKFSHIKRVLDNLDDSSHVGVCLDTAHTFEAGYDIVTKKGFDDVFSEFDKLIGMPRLKVVHFNDSLSVFASRVDRHEHLGKGNIGLKALGRIINYDKLKDAVFIMETPKESEKDDIKNLKIARKLFRN